MRSMSQRPFQDQNGRQYTSLKEAAELHGLEPGNIYYVLKRKRQSAGGFVFTYIDELEKVLAEDRERLAEKERSKQETKARNRARSDKWHEDHPGYMKNYLKEYNKTHREQKRESDRKSWLWTKYKITVEEFDLLLAKQNGRCAICGSDKPGRPRDKYFGVDHDHRTGAVRALLCFFCNTSLGGFKDSVKILQKAIDYLLGFAAVNNS